MTKHERMMERIQKHGEGLCVIFPERTIHDPAKLCKALRRLEAKASAITVALCNGPVDIDQAEEDLQAIEYRVNGITGFARSGVPVFINRDPRGYALKIESEWAQANAPRLHRDWGGYGILAPDLTED